MPASSLPLSKDQRRWLRRLDELLSWAEGKLASQPLPGDFVDLIIAQQTGGVHRIARAVLAQIRGGSSDQLESRMRALVEASINVRYIQAGDSERRARAFANSDVVTQKAIANQFASLMRQGKVPDMARLVPPTYWDGQAKCLGDELNEIETESGRVSDNWPRIEQRALKGDSAELYVTLFRLWSEDEHLTTRGLDKYMVVVNDSVYFEFSQDLHHLTSIIGMTYVYYLTMLRILSERAGHPSANELLRFANTDAEIRQTLAPSRYAQTGTSGSQESRE